MALLPMPYGYYTLLRFMVCSAAGYLALRHHRIRGLDYWVVCFGVMAVLFNPFVKVNLGREIWVIVDLLCAVLLVLNMKTMRNVLSGWSHESEED